MVLIFHESGSSDVVNMDDPLLYDKLVPFLDVISELPEHHVVIFFGLD